MRIPLAVAATLVSIATVATTGCRQSAPAQQQAQQMQVMPVQVAAVSLDPVPNGDTYVSTIKSRRSATLQPQVDGNLTRILVKSGDHVRAGQLLMTIDPLKQQATVASTTGTENQKKAVLQYNKAELERQKGLFEAGVVSKQAYEIALQNFQNAEGDYKASQESTSAQRQQLAYYQIRAPFDGIVGDIPVHQGDYVSATTLLTTVDENSQLEAYIYIPTERGAQVRNGLPVEILDDTGKPLVKSNIYFLSPQVENGMQSVLAKAPVPSSAPVRNLQIVKARVTWDVTPKPTVPVLAITRINGQPFVTIAAPQGNGYIAHQVAVKVGDAIGNTYPVLEGLKPGDKVITSGLQFLAEGMPVKPLS